MKVQIIIILIFAHLHIMADGAKYKFGKVTNEEVLSSSHHLESDAKAAILYQEGKVTLNYNTSQERFEVVREVYRRIKVYSESYKDIGTFTIPYYSHSKSAEIISGIKGTVFNNVNGKVKKSNLKKEHIFDEETSKYWSQKKIALPNVTKGSVIEIKYKVTSPHDYNIPRWYFQHDIPCDQSIYTVEIPEWFTYNTSSRGTFALDQSKQTLQRTISFWYADDSSRRKLGARRKPGYHNMNYKAHIIEYSASDIPSLRDEANVPHMNNYRSSISHDLLRTRMPDGTVKNYTKSWSDVAKTLSGHKDLGEQVSKKAGELDAVIQKVKDLQPDEQAIHLYNYVRDNYTWNEYYGKYAENGIKGLLKKRSGNIADINLLLANLYHKAGLAPVVVATRARDHGFINFYHPSVTDLNYLLVQYTQENGSKVLLDASDKNIEWGYLPGRALNMKGITLTSSGGQEVAIVNPNIRKTKIVAKANIDDDMDIVMNCTSTNTGYHVLQTRKSLSAYASDEDMMEYLESQHGDRSYESFSNETDPSKPEKIKLKENFKLENVTEELEDKIYIDGFLNMLNTRSNETLFASESRTLPIVKNDVSHAKRTFLLNFPQGYALDSAPEELSISLPNNMGKFSYVVSTQADKLVVNITLIENASIINPQDYKAFKRYYGMIASKAQEKIVLTRKM